MIWLSLACSVPVPPESEPAAPTDELCDDAVDNDWDGWVDCFDSDCTGDAACVEDCTDGSDNDQDGHADCWDPECVGTPDCIEDCFDGLDNDKDLGTDCLDDECAELPECQEICDDGLDNDQDGRIDCEDADCGEATPCIEDCGDGVDNDGDGLVDCEDAYCDGICSETSCVDGIDNDADGYLDCEDEECWGIGSCPASLALTLDEGAGTVRRTWFGHNWSGNGSGSGIRWTLDSVQGRGQVQTESGTNTCQWSASQLRIGNFWSAYSSGSAGVVGVGVDSTGACQGAITSADFSYAQGSFPFTGLPLQISSTTWVRYSTLWSSSTFQWHGTSVSGSKTRHVQLQPGGWWQKERP